MTPDEEKRIQEMMQQDMMALPATPKAGYGQTQSTPEESNPASLVLNPIPQVNP